MRFQFVSEVELRRIFNENRYYERMQEGEFRSRDDTIYYLKEGEDGDLPEW